jgi:hypothetical protein
MTGRHMSTREVRGWRVLLITAVLFGVCSVTLGVVSLIGNIHSNERTLVPVTFSTDLNEVEALEAKLASCRSKAAVVDESWQELVVALMGWGDQHTIMIDYGSFAGDTLDMYYLPKLAGEGSAGLQDAKRIDCAVD